MAADQSAAQLPALVALDRPYGFDEAVQKSFVPMFDEEREFAARHDNAKLADFLWRRPDAESHVQFGEANAQPLTGDIMGRIYYVNPRIRAF